MIIIFKPDLSCFEVAISTGSGYQIDYILETKKIFNPLLTATDFKGKHTHSYSYY